MGRLRGSTRSVFYIDVGISGVGIQDDLKIS